MEKEICCFIHPGYQKPARVQGAFVTDKEVQSVVEYLKNHNGDADYDNEIVQHVNTSEIGTGQGLGPAVKRMNATCILQKQVASL